MIWKRSGILKIDILALGMLTCIRKAFALLGTHYGWPLTAPPSRLRRPRL
jgi:DNA polymerase III alpha subunit